MNHHGGGIHFSSDVWSVHVNRPLLLIFLHRSIGNMLFWVPPPAKISIEPLICVHPAVLTDQCTAYWWGQPMIPSSLEIALIPWDFSPPTTLCNNWVTPYRLHCVFFVNQRYVASLSLSLCHLILRHVSTLTSRIFNRMARTPGCHIFHFHYND